MARKLMLIDDLDGELAEGTVRLGYNGTDYEIELSAANREKLEAALEPYISNGRRVIKRRAKRSTNGDDKQP